MFKYNSFVKITMSSKHKQQNKLFEPIESEAKHIIIYHQGIFF